MRIISQDARNVNSGSRWPIWRDEDQFAGKVAALPWQTLLQQFDQAGARDQLGPKIDTCLAARGGAVISPSLAELVGQLIRQIADSDIVILSQFRLPRNGIFSGATARAKSENTAS